MKILYVEDEIAHVELTQRTLEDNLQDRFILIHTESLQAALKIIETELDIDLVLTDLMIPEKSGMEAVRTIARDYPDMGVVMFTGFPTVDSAVESMKLGSLDYLPKPFSSAALYGAVEARLRKAQTVRQEAERRLADERHALRVLVRPRRLADEHDLRVRRAVGEDGLLVKPAIAVALTLPAINDGPDMSKDHKWPYGGFSVGPYSFTPVGWRITSAIGI